MNNIIVTEVINIAIPCAVALGNFINQEYHIAVETISSAPDITEMQRLKNREMANLYYLAAVFAVPGAFTALFSHLPQNFSVNEVTAGFNVSQLIDMCNPNSV